MASGCYNDNLTIDNDMIHYNLVFIKIYDDFKTAYYLLKCIYLF